MRVIYFEFALKKTHASGQGPTREKMREGYLKVTAIGRSNLDYRNLFGISDKAYAGKKKEKVIVRLGFTVDPGDVNSCFI